MTMNYKRSKLYRHDWKAFLLCLRSDALKQFQITFGQSTFEKQFQEAEQAGRHPESIMPLILN